MAKIRTFGSLLGESMKIYKKKYKRFIGVLLLALVGAFPLLLVDIIYVFVNMYEAAQWQVYVNFLLSLLFFFAVLAAMYFNVTAQIGLFLVVKSKDTETPLMIFKKAGKHFWSFALVVVMLAALMLFWTSLFIIPGIIFGIFYSLSYYALLYEGYEGTSAIKRSYRLVRDHWGQVAIKLIGMAVIWMLVWLFMVMPALFLPYTREAIVGWMIAYNLMVVAVMLVLTPLTVTFGSLVFDDLVKAKGKDKDLEKEGNQAVSWLAMVFIGIFILWGLISSISGLSATSSFEKKVYNRDIERMHDVYRIQSSLEAYRADAGQYPAAVIMGQPLTYNSHTYIILPENPKYGDGECPADFEYQYSQLSEGMSYQLTYCLGGNLKGHYDNPLMKSGFHTVNEKDFLGI